MCGWMKHMYIISLKDDIQLYDHMIIHLPILCPIVLQVQEMFTLYSCANIGNAMILTKYILSSKLSFTK